MKKTVGVGVAIVWAMVSKKICGIDRGTTNQRKAVLLLRGQYQAATMALAARSREG